MKKTALIVIALGIAAAGFFCREEIEVFLGLGRAPEKELKLFGNVEIRQVLLGFRVSGRLEKSYYEEGVRVESGALLGELDPLPCEIRRAEALAALRQGQANLAKMTSGYQTEEIRQAAAQRDQIRASLSLAEKDYSRLSHLFAQNAVSKKDLDSAASSRDRLRAELASAESALTLVRKGYRTEDIAAAEAAVELAEARLREADSSLADTKLYSPADGTILTRVAEPGTVLSAGQPVYALMLKKPIHVRAYVTEPQLGKIRPGMKGKIFTDSHPDPLEGTVAFIASEAEFTPKQVQTQSQRADLVYRIRLLVEDNPQDRLKNGMPVTVFLK
ncbi:MAG: HlyD family efflux transporter periplasmic adaptor subunit [Synergistaceae bacterium]|jgi:HlyD family secretion protein|nr:HlyD family efflux transporter periplasmic adaptor subunit [Synergistaceae bacterium]